MCVCVRPVDLLRCIAHISSSHATRCMSTLSRCCCSCARCTSLSAASVASITPQRGRVAPGERAHPCGISVSHHGGISPTPRTPPAVSQVRPPLQNLTHPSDLPPAVSQVHPPLRYLVEDKRPLYQLSSKRLEDNWQSGLLSSTKQRLSEVRLPIGRKWSHSPLPLRPL